MAYDQEDDDLPPLREIRDTWARARVGVTYVSLGVLMNMVMAILVQGSLLYFAHGDAERFNEFARLGRFDDWSAVVGCLGCVGGMGLILIFIGMCVSCAAPSPAVAGRARVAVLCQIGFAVVFVGSLMASTMRDRLEDVAVFRFNVFPDRFQQLVDYAMLAVAGLSLLLLGVSCVSWILYHAAVGRHFENERLPRTAYGLLGQIGFFVFAAIFVVSPVFSGMMKRTGNVVVLLSIGLAASVILGFCYLHLGHLSTTAMKSKPRSASEKTD